MTTRRTIPGRISIRRQVSPIDLLVGLGVVALLYGVARVGESLRVTVTPGASTSKLPIGLGDIPYYAACSLLRMFIALFLSTVFTFVYATAAARLRRAEKILVPTLDILQSVPILGFLTFTTVFFLRLFGSGGGWFFLTAAEAITVSGHQYALPGMGSYIGEAISQGSLSRVGVAVAVMIILVVGVNVLFFRPLVAWAEKFRMEESDSADKPRSLMLDLLRRSHVRQYLSVGLRPVGRLLDRVTSPFGLAEYPLAPDRRRQRAGDVVFWTIVGVSVALGAAGISYLNRSVGFGVFPYAIGLGAVTFSRVVVVVVVSTLIWVPVGVTIGMNPRLTRYAQPVVQILASFPSNLLFPFLVIAFVAIHLSLDIGSIVLMAIGAQWYILFNAIAGSIAIPNDLREMSASFGLSRRQRWRRLILPAIFPAYVTGGITAAGGAWNASIVAEVVVWGTHHLSAEGLGAYITNASNSGASDHFARVLAGVIVMSLFVVLVNRLLWRRLYRLAESHFTL